MANGPGAPPSVEEIEAQRIGAGFAPDPNEPELSPQEQAELQQLESQAGDLSPEEQAELRQLEIESGEVVESEVASGIRQEVQGQLEESFPQQALAAVGAAGEAIDRFTGAPVRAAIGAAQAGQPPGAAFAQQFGAPSAQAPTGEELAAGFGAAQQPIPIEGPQIPSGIDPRTAATAPPQPEFVGPEQATFARFTPAESFGFAIDVLADPTLLIAPALKPIQAAAKLAKATKVVQKSQLAVSNVATGLRNATVRIGEALSGVPAIEINTLIDKGEQVEKIIKRFGQNIPEAADAARESMRSQIQTARRSLNTQITGALDDASNPAGNISDVLASLEKSKAQINVKLNKKQVEALDEMIDDVRAVADDAGNTRLSNVFDVKQYLQEKAVFIKSNQIFARGSAPERAAKEASRIARKKLNELSPEIAQANNTLSKLHEIEGKINKNIIAPGKPEGALLSAGAGINRNRLNLQRLGEVIDVDLVSEAEKLAAAKRFAAPSITATDVTGKGLERFARGGAVGGLIGGAVGGVPGAVVGGGVGAALTSPFAVKQIVGGAKLGKKAARQAARFAGKVVPEEKGIRAARAVRAASIKERKEERRKSRR